MGLFRMSNAEDIDIGKKNNEGRLFKIVQLAATLICVVAIVLLILGAFQLLHLNSTLSGVIISALMVGIGGMSALPWVRIFERLKSDKRIKIASIVFIAVIGVCVILWIVCVWQIIGLVNSITADSSEESIKGLVNSLNTIRAAIIVSMQFAVASYIALNLIKYRKSLLPYQIMAGVGELYIDFYISLLLTAFTLTTEGFEISKTAMILTDKWTFALLIIAVVLLAFANIVFRRTDRRRLITTANDALDNSSKDKPAEADVKEKPAEDDGESIKEKLKKLEDLRDSDIITQEEYERKRSELIDKI